MFSPRKETHFPRPFILGYPFVKIYFVCKNPWNPIFTLVLIGKKTLGFGRVKNHQKMEGSKQVPFPWTEVQSNSWTGVLPASNVASIISHLRWYPVVIWPRSCELAV